MLLFTNSASACLQESARQVAEEVEAILSMFESGGGNLQRSMVVSIERIQHARLWRRYCIRRQELNELRGEEGGMQDTHPAAGSSVRAKLFT